MNKILKEKLEDFIKNIEPKIKKIDGPDYYVAQSQLEINSDLLIVGINPAGDKKLSEADFSAKSPSNLVQSGNQYLLNPKWHISKRLNKIFLGESSSKIYEKANIINLIALNTPTEKDLKKDELKELVKDCVEFSTDLIYDVIKPKAILLLGPSVAKYLNINFHHISDSVLRTEDNKNYLIVKVMKNNIPHYLICHPSARSFNSNEHLEQKMRFFENEFKS